MATTTVFRGGDRVKVTGGRIWLGRLGTVRDEHEGPDWFRVHVDGDPEGSTLPFNAGELERVALTPAVSAGTFRSDIDGASVVQIDTDPGVGRVRVMVNDGVVWDADPESGADGADLPPDPRDDALDLIAEAYNNLGMSEASWVEFIVATIKAVQATGRL